METMLVRRADAALHNGVDARGDGGDLDHRAYLGATGVAGELGHGVAVAVDVLVDGFVVHEVALEHVLGIGNALLRNGDTVGELDGVAAQGAGDLQLVEAERRGRASKPQHMYTAGSRPMEMEMGMSSPRWQYSSKNAPR